MEMSHWKKVTADLNKKLSVNSWFSDRFIISFSYFKSGYTFRNTSKSTSRKRKQSIALFLFSLTQLWSWRYNTGARPCRLLNLLTTHMRALAVIGIVRPLVNILAGKYLFSLGINRRFLWDPFFLLEGVFCCYPFHLEWLSHFLGWCFALHLWWWQFLLSFLLTKTIRTAFMSLCQGITCFC